MKNIDCDRNYLFSFYEKQYNLKNISNEIDLFQLFNKIENRNVNLIKLRFNPIIEFQDMDDISIDLYNDLLLYIKKMNIEMGTDLNIDNNIFYGNDSENIVKKDFYSTGGLCLKINNMLWSSDLIGLSFSKIKFFLDSKDHDKKSKEMAYDYLYECRKFSGQIMWPCKEINEYKTINQCKGIKIDDRFDVILLLIKQFYESNNLDSVNEETGYVQEVLKQNKDYFEKFRNFNTFVNFWNLKGNFVNEDYCVVDILSKDEIDLRKIDKISKKNIETYLKNSKELIIKRNKQISQNYNN